MKRRNLIGHRGLGKALGGLLLLCGLGFLLTGCTLDKKSVKLHTKEEMQKIVDERYGDAELVSIEENEEKHYRIFTYRDTKYGFTYQVTSHPNAVGMDGSTFYYDGAGIYYSYEEPFLSYFYEQEKETFARQGIELCEEMGFPSNFEYPVNRKFCLKSKELFSSPEQYGEDMKFVWDRVHAYKVVPETTGNYELNVYNSEQAEFLGTLKEDGFVTALEQRIEYYMQQAESLGGIQGVTYLRCEKKKVSEVPGLSDQVLYEKKNTVTVYYYSYEGKEYFIVDLWVAQIGENGGGIFQYYQNYKYYEPSRD
ncbi:MAG: hypothetical protein IJU80_10035 [Lachnospiraceae bacterium]|nr:hypothetical protein [Lachnospiraceae bacterium]